MKNRKVVAVVIWSVVAALLAGGLAYFGGLLDRVRGVAAVVEPDHAEREAVRAWLRENTDSGKWEEVRWWRAKKMTGPIEREIRHHEETIEKWKKEPTSGPRDREIAKEEIAQLEGKIQKLRTTEPDTALRVKLRTHVRIAGLMLEDSYFLIENGKATPTTQVFSKDFPD